MKNWKDYEKLSRVWAKTKHQIKDRNFLKSLDSFDIRTVRKKDIQLIKEMYEGDKWMKEEKVTRHKGIAVESSFSLAMYRWCNTIIEFVSITEKMDQIGINEIESKIELAK